jgi:hypothetical protein
MTLPECLRVRRAGAWVELLDADVIVLVVCVAWPSENERRKWERADLDRMEKERAGCVRLTIVRVFSVARLAGADSAPGINEHGGHMEETVCRMGQARAKWQWATLHGVARESPNRSEADAQAEQPAGVRPAYGLPSFPLPPMSSTRLFPGPSFTLN